MNNQTITTTGWTGHLGMGLAPRELEATLLAAADLTVKEVARAMGIAPKTAEKRLEAARFKLGAKTIRGLVLEAFKRQIISPAIIALCAIMVGHSLASTDEFTRVRRSGERKLVETRIYRRADCAWRWRDPFHLI